MTTNLIGLAWAAAPDPTAEFDEDWYSEDDYMDHCECLGCQGVRARRLADVTERARGAFAEGARAYLSTPWQADDGFSVALANIGRVLDQMSVAGSTLSMSAEEMARQMEELRQMLGGNQ